MTWLPYDTWIVVVGALCAVACALPGCFLVLRGMSMMGDAISHAVLPGLAIGFLVTGSRASLPMFIGAAVVGVLIAVFTQWVSKFGRVDRGAAMGIVFTTLFALGLLLIVRAADKVDLDPGCVLYGAVEMTPLDVGLETEVFGTLLEIPRAAVVLGSILLVNLGLILLLYKELNISSFDPELATVCGINATRMHYLLMSMVAVTTVASFEAVGSIIVIAMLVVPSAAAYLLTHRLSTMLGFSAVFAVLAALLGHLGALTVPAWFGFQSTSTSGGMAVAAGLLFLLAWILAPHEGLLSTFLKTRKAARNANMQTVHRPS
jgi:manganese/zinc/iron transport system permease protein